MIYVSNKFKSLPLPYFHIFSILCPNATSNFHPTFLSSCKSFHFFSRTNLCHCWMCSGHGNEQQQQLCININYHSSYGPTKTKKKKEQQQRQQQQLRHRQELKRRRTTCLCPQSPIQYCPYPIYLLDASPLAWPGWLPGRPQKEASKGQLLFFYGFLSFLLPFLGWHITQVTRQHQKPGDNGNITLVTSQYDESGYSINVILFLGDN